jgi:ribosomal protein S5
MNLKELEDYKKMINRLKEGDKFRILLDNLKRQQKTVKGKSVRFNLAVVEEGNSKGKINYGLGLASTSFVSNVALKKGVEAMYKAIIKQVNLEFEKL